MAERKTRYDNVVKSGKPNPFEKANSTLKGAPDTDQTVITQSEPVKTEPKQVVKQDIEQVISVYEDANTSTTTDESVPLTKNGKLDINSLFPDAKKKESLAKTFYMDKSNYAKLEKIAKSQKISVSKALNEILRNIL